MGKKGFTKGPWDVTTRTIKQIDELPITIHYVEAMGGDDKICKLFNVGNGDQKSNAHLVSAAPDLLQALQNIINDFDGNWEHYEQSKKAIAKAKGE